jgi:methylaspartate ammonia-lyase
MGKGSAGAVPESPLLSEEWQPMRVDALLCARGTGAFFYDDQAAIRSGVASDGFLYVGAPRTDGFPAIRMPAESLSVGLLLDDGQIAWGDMMSVQYSGGSGRDPVFRAEAAEQLVRTRIQPRVTGLEIQSFRDACEVLFQQDEHGDGLPLAVEYGLSQALLRAQACATRRTMAEVICEEYGIAMEARPVPLYAQSGDARHINVDKMILKNVDILPHGLVNSREKFGPGGETFLEFVEWVSERVRKLGAPDYWPTLHFDVYGWIGQTFNNEPLRIAEFIARAAERAWPFSLNIESPADFGSRERQITGFKEIMEGLGALGCPAKIVADEWCNTLDDIRAFCAAGAADIVQIKMPDVGSITNTIAAVLDCKRAGVGAYVGGSCVETELSAQVSTHVAVATQADMLLAKPGMGVDEAVSIVGNEQNRLLAILAHRQATSADMPSTEFIEHVSTTTTENNCQQGVR